MELDKVIIEEIEKHGSKDPRDLSTHIKEVFGTFVPPTVIAKVRGNIQRRTDITKAKDRAAQGLDDKIELVEQVSGDLLTWFNNETLDPKTRLEAIKELRQWTKLGIDVSGIHDEEDDSVWLIGQAWALDDE